jgi:hypothetical protein
VQMWQQCVSKRCTVPLVCCVGHAQVFDQSDGVVAVHIHLGGLQRSPITRVWPLADFDRSCCYSAHGTEYYVQAVLACVQAWHGRRRIGMQRHGAVECVRILARIA